MGGNLTAQSQDTQILDNESVHLRPGRRPDELCRLGTLPVGNQGVYRQMHCNPPDVGVLHRLPQGFQCKVPGALAGVEGPHSQIHRIGAILHCSPQSLHGSGGSQ